MSRTVTSGDKSFPATSHGRPVDAVNLPLSAFATPLFVVSEPTMAHNIEFMARWVASRGLELMPHGKTTMAPALWRRQLDAGATGITVATGWQALLALRAGVPVVQIANMCVDPGLLSGLSEHLIEHPDQEVILWADSVDVIARMEEYVSAGARIGLLAELGGTAGRTGARTADGVWSIVKRAEVSNRVTLRGVAGYEGALAHDRSDAGLRVVDAFCRRLAELGSAVSDYVEGPVWISAGGSAYPDIVADALAGIPGTRGILRSGAYIVHDSGFYRGISPFDRDRGRNEADSLLPAMRGYTRVVSQPERGLALLDAGKRDFPFDEGLPVVMGVASVLGGPERQFVATVTAMNDQHSFLSWEGDPPVRVGDVVSLGLSHPCTAFDKWRLIPLVNAEGMVEQAVETCF